MTWPAESYTCHSRVDSNGLTLTEPRSSSGLDTAAPGAGASIQIWRGGVVAVLAGWAGGASVAVVDWTAVGAWSAVGSWPAAGTPAVGWTPTAWVAAGAGVGTIDSGAVASDPHAASGTIRTRASSRPAIVFMRMVEHLRE